MINKSELLTSIKMSLGIYQMKLPFENDDDFLMDVIRTKTIPIYSNYFPYRYKKLINTTQLQKLSEGYTQSEFRIPLSLVGNKRIVSIININSDVYNRNMANYDPNLSNGSIYGTAQSFMLHLAAEDNMSIMEPSFTWKFSEPNILTLYNFSNANSGFEIDFGLRHDEDLSTIKDTGYSLFYELCMVDIKEVLYNSLKHYNEIQTAFGNINLRIDDWSDAVSQRKDLIEQFEDSYLQNYPHIYTS